MHDLRRRILNIGDDRVRFYTNPFFDDAVIELWRVNYTYNIDYKAAFWENEQTSLTWAFKPYGDHFNGRMYTPTESVHLKSNGPGKMKRHISVIEICAAFHQRNVKDKRVPMSSWLEDQVKKRYDNLFCL